MKLGFYATIIQECNLSLEETVSKDAKMSFDGIELECTTYRTSPLDRKGVKRVKELIDSNGLDILNLAPQPDLLISTGEDAMVKELLVLKDVMEMAVDMDVDLIRV